MSVSLCFRGAFFCVATSQSPSLRESCRTVNVRRVDRRDDLSNRFKDICNMNEERNDYENDACGSRSSR